MGKILLAVVVGLCAFAWRIYEKTDMGRTIYNHRPGVCRQVNGPGKMFLYDFNQNLRSDQLKARELPIKGVSFDQDNFHPHGLSHWVVNGVIRLYVINHDDEFKHSVQVFDYDPTGPALIHKQTIKHPTFVRPNDLVVVGPDQFIFTNDGYNGGSVYFWDGKEAHELITGIGGPNGIAYDFASDKVFVSDVVKRRIHAYDLSKDKKSITHLSAVNVYSGCDNLFLDSDGSLYSGCHPVLIEAAKALGDCEGPSTSASHVLRIKFDRDYKSAAITEPYANDGKEVSGSTIGIVYNNQMLIGTLCKGLYHCEIGDRSVL
ncbi:hypothetical protein PENTCL1PPCAC_14514, partial [Pristionchus entomophagus]